MGLHLPQLVPLFNATVVAFAELVRKFPLVKQGPTLGNGLRQLMMDLAVAQLLRFRHFISTNFQMTLGLAIFTTGILHNFW